MTMTQSYGHFCLIVLAVLLATAAAGRGQEVSRSTGCVPIPEGDWVITHIFPPAPGNNTIIAQGRSVLNLRRDVIPGVYSGSGAGVASNAIFDGLPRGAPFNYYVHGMVVEELCALSGTLYDFDLTFVDPFLWYYNGGDTMRGPYFNAANNSVLFTNLSHHELTYIGQL